MSRHTNSFGKTFRQYPDNTAFSNLHTEYYDETKNPASSSGYILTDSQKARAMDHLQLHTVASLGGLRCTNNFPCSGAPQKQS